MPGRARSTPRSSTAIPAMPGRRGRPQGRWLQLDRRPRRRSACVDPRRGSRLSEPGHGRTQSRLARVSSTSGHSDGGASGGGSSPADRRAGSARSAAWARLAELVGDGLQRELDHPVAVASRSSDCGPIVSRSAAAVASRTTAEPALAHLLRLVAEPAAGGRAEELTAPHSSGSSAADGCKRGGRVEADHEVESLSRGRKIKGSSRVDRRRRRRSVRRSHRRWRRRGRRTEAATASASSAAGEPVRPKATRRPVA